MTTTTTLPRIATRLRQARQTLGWSLVRAAAEAGVTPTMVYRWETGERRPTVRSLGRLADAYGLTVGHLLEYL